MHALFILAFVVGISAVADAEKSLRYQARDQSIKQYVKQMAVDWDWFMYRPHGSAGLPLVLLKSLPELAPEIWGKPEEKFARFGHFVLPGDEKRILPSTLAYGPLSKLRPILITTLSCGTCHTGRVRVNDKVEYLYGGVNTQFDNRKWRHAIELTAQNYLANETKVKKTAQRLREIVKSKPWGFFHENRAIDFAQRRMFSVLAEKTLTSVAQVGQKLAARTAKQRKGPYGKPNSPNIDGGNPGQVDASGDVQANALPLEKMPQWASLSDIPAVWEQDERNVGQWDGSVHEPFFRNLAAQIAIVPPATVDQRVAAHSVPFMAKLPAPAYPFSIDDTRASKGKVLFEKNCKECHQPLNKTVYQDLGTDSNRAKILTAEGFQLMKKTFAIACPKGKYVKGYLNSYPCDQDIDKVLPRDTSLPENQGYVATPLTGIWASAPYLHNGSVPTLHHLLVPDERPTQFVVGALDYDSKKIGFVWDSNLVAQFRRKDPVAAVVDSRQDGLSHSGHDRDIVRSDGTRFKLDWSATEDLTDRENLLEYLKAL